VSALPTLSVVVTARNDDHGGSLLRRMQIFIDGWIEQSRRHRLDSELIIVEWNPPADRAPLAKVLKWPRDTGACCIRIITVPSGVHERFRHADKLPLFQMIAKNVGVRRAQGRFVLCTNVDLLFSDELVRFLASGRLQLHDLYRIDRRDVPASVPVGVSVVQQLSYCARHVVRINTRWGTFRTNRWGALPLPPAFWIVWVWGSRALRVAVHKSWSGVLAIPHRWKEILPYVHQATRKLGGAIVFAVGRVMLLSSQLLVHSTLVERLRLKCVHTNGCGDFMLLSRDRWHLLRGYPEAEMFSLHLDSLLCHTAVISGAREVVLGGRKRLYHIEHGSGWSPEEADRLIGRMRSLGVPVLDFASYKRWIEGMRNDPAARIFNHEHWGLGLEQLPETDPTKGVAAQPEGERLIAAKTYR
jgi:hypothetical protein